jgi:phosphomannomutase
MVDDFSSYADEVLAAFTLFAEQQEGWSLTPDNYEGVHVTTENGWILMRKSLHDPQIPINIESDEVGGIEPMAEKVRQLLAAFVGLE